MRTILVPLTVASLVSLVALGSPMDVQSGEQRQTGQPMQQQQQAAAGQQSAAFDISSYRNIYEAIQNHPELREFASLCQLDGVKEIVSMAMTPLTVFAPTDLALAELVSKAKSRSMSLIELARHHIAQEQLTLELNTRYPLKKLTYANLSPLYLSQVPAGKAGKQASTFVNNAKILSTHLLPIGETADAYQTLHIIDQPLEFAHSNRRAQLRPQSAASQPKWTTVRKPLSLDELLGVAGPEAQQLALAGLADYLDRFADLRAQEAQVGVFQARPTRSRPPELNLNRLGVAVRSASPAPAELRGRLLELNESLTLNTYFLPVTSDELEAALAGQPLTRLLEAHVLPDQVLFTRAMQLGVGQPSLFERHSSAGQRVTLSLAKTLPEHSADYLATPLLLQARCSAPSRPEEPAAECRPGVTSAEIVVANVPITSGVLHLIKRPLLATSQLNVLDYLNDHDNQLSQLVQALGSQSAPTCSSQEQLLGAGVDEEPPRVNRFRELLARERQLLAQFAQEPQLNATILAPSDQAFGRLRFELRALVQGDEALVPKHWTASYRQDLIERLVRRHVVAHQTIASEQVQLAPGQLVETLADNGKPIRFSSAGQPDCSLLQVESDGSRGQVLQRDLIGNNGVLHIIDRVLGEELETVHSLLHSLVLRFNQSQSAEAGEQPSSLDQLVQLVQASLKSEPVGEQANSVVVGAASEPQAGQQVVARHSPELSLIAKSIGRYLDELAGSSSGQRQLQQVAASVNMSYQLARLSSLAEGQDDWNDMFKQPERTFTYFVPSDLAWFRLLQAHPELYRPLMQTLGGLSGALAEPIEQPESSNRPHYSESSHRLRQILERHLVVNRRLTREELNGMDSLQTLGANLRLTETHQSSSNQQQLTAPPEQASAFASLQSLVGMVGQSTFGQHQTQSQTNKQQIKRSLRLRGDSVGQQAANIVQAHEASNGFVYIIDNVLLTPEDPYYLLQTSSPPSASSSILGGHSSYLGDLLHGILSPTPFNLSASTILALISTLTLAISILLVLALVLLVRRQRQNKLNRHQQLESGLTSSSSANSGSTSTTKSL